MEDGRRILEDFWAACNRNDFDAMAAAYADDAVQEWPQSGERVVGVKNIMAINLSYPGLPTATVRRVIGHGHLWVCEATLDYAGETYEAVSIVEVSSGKITKEITYFATPFDAPEWRAQWTEKT